MTSIYTYPENKLSIIDGSLRPTDSVPEDIVLVIDRAKKGPSNTLYLVQDMNVAKQLFGEDSPLIRLANNSIAAQARNIGLFRIGGGAYEYVNIFGEGTSLSLTQESLDAADNIKVYVGPEPKNASRQCVIVYDGDKIIYSNVLGSERMSSRVIVNGFNKATNEVKIGTFQNPVEFKKIGESIGATATAPSTAVTKQDVDGTEWYLVEVASIAGFEVGTDDVSTITVVKSGTTDAVTYTVTDDKTKLLINKFVDGASEFVKDSDTVDITFNKKTDESTLKDQGLVYNKGKDSMNATYKELYESLDQALDLLELVPSKALVVPDLFSTNTSVAQGSKLEGALEYLVKGEDEDGYTTYEWSKDKYVYRKQGTEDETTTDISESAIDNNGQPIILKSYNEVDFVHRLGMFAYNKLSDGHFVNIIVGAQGPANSSPRAINDWIGKSPVYDVRGNIVEDGTGLLGHPLMVGTTKYKGGYFATSNGFVDGDVLVDYTSFPIDLGKHISIVVSQVTTPNQNVPSSGAAAYAGLVANVGPGDSTTNKSISSLFLAFDIKESKRKELAKAGYVVFQDKPKGLTVYSGDLATRENSDFDYISTAIAIAETTKLITEISDPFIGRGLDIITRVALETQLTTAMSNAQKEGWFISYKFDIRREGPNELLIPYMIQTKDELRKITHLVRLTRDENFIDV